MDANGLNGLFAGSAGAREYFDSLPGDIQEMILQRRESIKTEDDLHRYADNLLRG